MDESRRPEIASSEAVRSEAARTGVARTGVAPTPRKPEAARGAPAGAGLGRGAPALGVLAFLAAALALCSGCRIPDEREGSAGAPSLPAERSTGDWEAIRERGVIRFVRRAFADFETLPSQGLSKERYRLLAERFAARHGLAAEWLAVSDITGLFAALDAGRADVAADTLTVTRSRQERVRFTVPLTISREWVIGRHEGVFGIPRGTAYEESLAAHFPDAVRAPVPSDADPLRIRTLIEEGAFDATIMDEAAARVVARSSPVIRKLAELPEPRRIAWAVRRENPALRDALDGYLTEHHFLAEDGAAVRNWAAVKASGQLRMLTLSSPATYYLWRGEQLGFEYELVRGFASAHDLDLTVIVARDHAELVEALAAGRGDLVAAGWVETAARRDRGLLFTHPYLEIRETFVTRDEPISTLADLAGRTVTVPPATSYAATLAGLDGDFEVVEVERSSDLILESVAAGEVELTLVDSHRAELAATFEPTLALGLALEPAKHLVWAVAPGNGELKEQLDGFLDASYRGYEWGVLRNKYFVNRRRQQRQREHRVTGDELSPYDAIVKPLAEAQHFDWRLIVAQIYQESGFDPQQVSFAGARGLMQIMPRTAEELGVDPDRLTEPETGIAAGVRYLAWTRDRFPNLSPGEQPWFALASYNAGYGHVLDGRRLAHQLGLDGSRWFGNVEKAMLRLSEPEYARQAAYGYVRGSEVAGYVEGIRNRYRAYVDHFLVLDGVDR